MLLYSNTDHRCQKVVRKPVNNYWTGAQQQGIFLWVNIIMKDHMNCGERYEDTSGHHHCIHNNCEIKAWTKNSGKGGHQSCITENFFLRLPHHKKEVTTLSIYFLKPKNTVKRRTCRLNHRNAEANIPNIFQQKIMTINVKIINMVISMGYQEISSVTRSWLLGNLGELSISVNSLMTGAKDTIGQAYQAWLFSIYFEWMVSF